MIDKELKAIIDVSGLKNYFGDQRVHEDVNLKVNRGDIIAIIGGSGCGKTTLLRSILMLHEPTEGEIKVFGIGTGNIDHESEKVIQRNWGVMFQSCALFTSLTIVENIMFPIEHATDLDANTRRDIALLKLALSGLGPEVADKYPSELSGGMKKRAALARAIALDPQLVFLDEPTAGLDPVSASDLDGLILHLRKQLGITFVMVTHDLDTLWRVPDRVIFLGEGRVLADQPMKKLVNNPNPLIKQYFSSERSAVRN
ncbi:MAG: ABC transporter ATP-binding protein [Coxiellaceae bacterium]|nr:ABC transporter ATP-binding protein [Coxiellaceae bacterium]|tara:strand:+ start:416 stop:1183 length:768 start_codon:yes stop_codon:yes gene_type:complete